MKDKRKEMIKVQRKELLKTRKNWREKPWVFYTDLGFRVANNNTYELMTTDLSAGLLCLGVS